MQKKTFTPGNIMLASVGIISLIILVSRIWAPANLVSWIWAPANTLVPNELIGEWHTSNASYSDRSFAIDPVSISFGTGGGTVNTGFIKEVSAVPQGARTLYTISYKADESVYKVSFYYETGKGKVIHFTHQDGIAWTKD